MAPLPPSARTKSTTSKRTAAKPQVRFAHKSGVKKSRATGPISTSTSTATAQPAKAGQKLENVPFEQTTPPAPATMSAGEAEDDEFPSWLERASKKDKRLMRHSLIVAQARASAQATGRIAKTRAEKRRRRPQNKLRGASMDDMADALADVAANGEAETRTKRRQKSKSSAAQADVEPRSSSALSKPSPGQSLHIKRGVHKRRENINKLERSRFSQNMAQFLSAKTLSLEKSSSNFNGDALRNAKWQALQTHILQNMNVKNG